MAPIRTQRASTEEAQTPLMKQYWELKSQAGEALLLFRMGDFYELFGQDAIDASQILEITLTTRDKNKPNPIPMAGVPYHSVQGYIQKLLDSGRKVAIGEQFEETDPSRAGTKIVQRKIVRFLTPAVQFEAEGSDPRYLATFVPDFGKKSGSGGILAYLDPSTGEVLLGGVADVQQAESYSRRFPIRHFLKLAETSFHPVLDEATLVETLPENYLSSEQARDLLNKHYETIQLDSFVPNVEAQLALGILITYVLRTQQQDCLSHLRYPEPIDRPQNLTLGANTAQHLDLAELFRIIDHTRCCLGTRQLKRWMNSPLKDLSQIQERQTAVEELSKVAPGTSTSIRQLLAAVYDLERICGRVNTQLAGPKDTLSLGQSLGILRELQSYFHQFSAPRLAQLNQVLMELWEQLAPLAGKILTQQKEEAPLHARDGGIFKMGTSPELDRLIELTENGQKWIVELETKERTQTGISSLKVRYNRVFGYYIEVTHAHLKNVPGHYQRKQTMVGAERFFTEELKEFEEEILTASARQKALEQDLFQGLLSEVRKQTSKIMAAAQALGEIDSLFSLARIAQQPGWSFPVIDESYELHIEAGRHPLVDHARPGIFVPNDLHLSPETRLTLMITGPNMGGKSTYMRQAALIVILGQMGSTVPAQSARWGLVSSIHTRIGAQDALSRGQSTFMVEMSELASILHQADSRSLVILDEIGRGTSTFDGISVAWATLEWICTRIRSRTLFATHYHELIQLAEELPQLANVHVAVESTKTKGRHSLRFLYELKEGPTNESFGIQVAQLAGLPKPIIARAWKVLEDLESQGHSSLQGAIQQPSLFDTYASREERVQPEESPPHPILKELEGLDLNQMTPIQALNLVARLKEMAS